MLRWLLSTLIVWGGGCKSSKNAYDTTQIIQETQRNFEEKKYEIIIQHLEALETYQQPQILELLAFAYEANGNFLKAAQTFGQVFHIDLSKHYTENSLYAAQIYQQLNYNEAAACYYRYYIDHFPKDSESWLALAMLESKLEHWDAALVAFLNAISYKDKINAEETYQLARLCQKANLWDAAEFWLLQSLKTTKTPIKPLKQLLKLALVLNDRDKIQKSISALEKYAPKFFDNEPWKSIRNAYLPQIILEQNSKTQTSIDLIKQSLNYFQYPLDFTFKIKIPTGISFNI